MPITNLLGDNNIAASQVPHEAKQEDHNEFTKRAFMGVLATYHIRPLNQAFKSTIPGLSQLADSPEEEYNRNVFICSSSKGVMYTVHGILLFIKHSTSLCLQSLHRFVVWTKPDTTSLLLGTLTDLARSKSELVAENALLRQQLIILHRQVKRPACTKTDRLILVLLARASRAWKHAFFIVQPETLLRWHRQGFRLFWKYKSRAASSKPKIPAETVALIKEMAAQNRLWGADRIRGEVLKLGIHVSKRTIQKYMRHARSPRQRGQNWATFLQNHAKDIWACDFLQVTDLFFRSLFAFFIIDMQSRKVIHVGVTRFPTDAWTARTAAGGDSLWTIAEISHSRSRYQIWILFRSRSRKQRHQDAHHALPRATSQCDL